jgi:hypothetical protein
MVIKTNEESKEEGNEEKGYSAYHANIMKKVRYYY